jgi:hypothetical protein
MFDDIGSFSDIIRCEIVWSNFSILSLACFKTIAFQNLLLELPSRLVILILRLTVLNMKLNTSVIAGNGELRI